MSAILTSTFAPTAMANMNLSTTARAPSRAPIAELAGNDLQERMLRGVRQAEELGIDQLLVAQRWWGSGEEIEGSTYDCLAMTAFYAAHTTRIGLITAIHPGFFLPAPIAKWGATIDRLTDGRWSINVTSGWHEAEFGMFGAELLEHDDRYGRSTEFIEVMRRAWSGEQVDFEGRFYHVRGLRLEPRPKAPLMFWQGGQSSAAIAMAAKHSDWMFLNGGRPEKIAGIIEKVRASADATGRRVRFALYAIPHCRATDAEAEGEIDRMIDAIDPAVVERRVAKTSGAKGMWASDDKLSFLDTNEGYASRLIGSPDTILRRMGEFHALGVDCFHLVLHDQLFNREVLPALRTIR
ncbi:MAG TPA: LLM class flavin-dependent oxidoreductase [Candidatus Binataceae bacterium]|nr:LLM class flavin-dependent oxidoreductase [Candidatus Binataceae bacterium]